MAIDFRSRLTGEGGRRHGGREPQCRRRVCPLPRIGAQVPVAAHEPEAWLLPPVRTVFSAGPPWLTPYDR
jgi:hypothetical protein